MYIYQYPFYNILPGETRGAVRLSQYGVSSPTYYYGQLQIYWDDGWNNICDDASFSTNEGEVACHQLGYTGLRHVSNTRFNQALSYNQGVKILQQNFFIIAMVTMEAVLY